MEPMGRVDKGSCFRVWSLGTLGLGFRVFRFRFRASSLAFRGLWGRGSGIRSSCLGVQRPEKLRGFKVSPLRRLQQL